MNAYLKPRGDTRPRHDGTLTAVEAPLEPSSTEPVSRTADNAGLADLEMRPMTLSTAGRA